jgi:hypothetical protein
MLHVYSLKKQCFTHFEVLESALSEDTILKRLFVCLLTLCVLLILPASAGVLYTNDPLNGYLNDPINGGFGPPGSPGGGFAWNITQYSSDSPSVSDSFTLSSAATVTGFDFATWNFSGDVTTTVDWSIGTAAFGSDFSGTAGLSNSLFGTNPYSFNVYTNTATGLSVSLAAGTYWLTLQNAVTTSGRPVYWDENDGPSVAFQTTTGSLAHPPLGTACANGAVNVDQSPTCTGSETFDIVGNSTVPEPGSLGLLGCGILALAGLLRRKIA